MNWYTCIIHNPEHVTSVQYFFTRAANASEAEGNALNWIFNGDPSFADPAKRDMVDVPFVFEGRHEPCEPSPHHRGTGADMEAKWIPYEHDECPECGGSIEILTSCPQDERPEGVPDEAKPPWMYDGDEWRCEDGHTGTVSCDSETLASLGIASLDTRRVKG